MSKKQENKKLIKQNKRNQIINKRYRSTIKTLGKLFFLKIKMFLLEIEQEKKEELKKEVQQLIKNFYSIVDKAVKKNVIHQNSAARKKSKIGKLFSTI
jgi:small subunit ribosomal protein S20